MIFLFLGKVRVEFSHSTYNGSESSGSIVVTLMLRGGRTSEDLIVAVKLSDISASSSKGSRCVTFSLTNLLLFQVIKTTLLLLSKPSLLLELLVL